MRRLLSACIVALTLSGTAVVVRAQWSPICVTFEEGSLEWWFFGCWIDPPPKDPSA